MSKEAPLITSGDKRLIDLFEAQNPVFPLSRTQLALDFILGEIQKQPLLHKEADTHKETSFYKKVIEDLGACDDPVSFGFSLTVERGKLNGKCLENTLAKFLEELDSTIETLILACQLNPNFEKQLSAHKVVRQQTIRYFIEELLARKEIEQ